MASYSVEGDLITHAVDSQHGKFMELYRQICDPVSNHVGKHRLSCNWSWDRHMRFRVNLKGGAFGA